MGPWLVAIAGFLVMFVPSYWQAGNGLWQTDEFGHGPIILAVSVWLLWQRREALLQTLVQPSPGLGAALFALGALLYLAGRALSIASAEFLAHGVMAAAVLACLGGSRAMRVAWFPLLYLLFMVPLPASVVDAVTGPLKHAVSVLVVEGLHAVGYPIARSGVMISIGPYQLLVADACSGLNSMFSLAALGTLFIHVVSARRTALHVAILISAILPIAFAANIVRVLTLVLVTYHLGDEAGQGFLHGAAGIVLMLVALAIFFALDLVLAAVFGRHSRSARAYARGRCFDMPAHITAYVYVMAMALTMFALLKRPLTATLMTPEDFARRRNAWIGMTSAVFLAHNFWVFLFAAAVIVLLTAQRERNPPALYFMLLLAVPNFEVDLPGLGVVNYLYRLSPARLLSLLILVPMAWRLVQSRHTSETSQRVSQGFVLVFAALSFVVFALADNPINTLANNVRNLLDLLLLIVVPFYVMTHGVRDLRQLRDVLASFLMALAVLGFVALFETLRYWLVFDSLRGPLGLPPASLTLYVIRETDGGGALRAMTTAGHPIVLGWVMGVGVCLWVALRKSMQPATLGLAALAAVSVGLVVALSRGPWIGTAAGLLVLVLAGPNAGKRFVVTAAVLTVGFGALMVTPYGDKVLGYIPFIGNVEKGTVDYRVELVRVSMQIFWDNPILGSYNSLIDPRLEVMRQGQGIVDMVNTYLGVGLQYGIVGVVLFTTPFLVATVIAITRARAVETEHAMMGLTGRALAGVMVMTLVTIATTSSVEYLPLVYWPLLGCATAYLGISARWRLARSGVAARAPAARHAGRTAPTGPAPQRPQIPARRPAHKTYADRT